MNLYLFLFKAHHVSAVFDCVTINCNVPVLHQLVTWASLLVLLKDPVTDNSASLTCEVYLYIDVFQTDWKVIWDMSKFKDILWDGFS